MPKRRTLLVGGASLAGAALVGGILLPGAVLAQKLEVYVNSDGVAINGYDPVAYFREGAPVEGLPEFTARWKRVTWQFSSAENRDLFMASPEDYAPQYGGYCAYAVSRGYIASTVPEAWTIFEGKLYLNFSLGVRDTWRRDMEANIAKADANWPGVLE